MVMKTAKKDLLREIKHSFGRFFAIFAIVLLGVAFFAGVSASPDNMHLTAETYFDTHRLQDLRLISSIGFTKEEVEKIRDTEGIRGVYAAYTLDVLGKTAEDENESVFSLMSVPTDLSDGNEDYMNCFRLYEGRLPEKESECVIRVSAAKKQPISVGDRISLRSGTETELNENLTVSELTVVGLVYTPYSISFDLGNSEIGNGRVSYLLWLPDTAFRSEYYTNVFVTLEGSEALDSFADEYSEKTEATAEEFKKLGETCIAERIVGIKAEIREEVAKEVTKEVTERVTEEVEKAVREEIEKTVLTEVENAVREAISEEVRTSVEKEVRNAISRETKKAVENAVREGIEKEVRTKVEEAVRTGIEKEVRKKVEEAVRAGIEAEVRSEVEASVKAGIEAEVKASVPELFYEAALQKAMDENFEKTVNEVYPSALQKAMDENFETAVTEEYPAALEKALSENFEKTVEEEVEKALPEALSKNFQTTVNAKFPAAYQKAIAENYDRTVEEEYEKALQKALSENLQKTVAEEYPVALEEAMAENFEKTVAETVPEEVEKILPEKIEEVYTEQAEENLRDAGDWKWYVLDRESQASFVEYRSAIETMRKIAAIFPLFFFFVAALVCFTTMTRMVDEERMLIGTYMAIGYEKRTIAGRYVRYALYAALSGGISGCFLGMRIFPGVIMNAWGIAYQMPGMLQANHLKIDLLSISSITLTVVLAALLALVRDLFSVPAALMRPKAPKHGKTVFLEKIGFIWKRLSFSKKVTVRNILRYRKRFAMTLAGVAGCTALLVTGFGVSDSVSHLVGTQYGEIYRYDAAVTLTSGLSLEEREETFRELSELPEFTLSLPVFMCTAAVNVPDDTSVEDLDVTLTVLPSENAGEFLRLWDDRTGAILELGDEGAILPQMTAEKLGLKSGDEFLLENRDGVRHRVKVSGIAEFYVGHQVFLSEACYEDIFGAPAEKNTLLTLSELSEEEIPGFSAELMEREEISSVSFFNLSVKNIRQMTAALGIVTMVLIVSSLLLSFVVLYNMTNVNISERIREIATIKVLGFYDPEVHAYIYRESIAITVLGALLGLFVGVLLHHYIMGMIAMDAVSFGDYIDPKTYLYSFFLTILFSVIVSIFISGKLKRVPMVESLKAVE